MRVAVTDGRLGVLARSASRSDIRRGPEPVLAEAIEVTRKLLAEQGVERPAGLGIGVPGPVNFQAGAPVSPPIMPGWDKYPVRDALSRELGCPVLVDNDVNVMALGEQHTGVARSASAFLFVKIGTGIGCGIVVDRHLYRGADGCAGDIGHIRSEQSGPLCACGNQGCLEAFFGGAALARDATAAARSGRSAALAEMLEDVDELTAEHVGVAMGQGDAVALQLTRDGGRRVGAVAGQPGVLLQPRPDRHRWRRGGSGARAPRRDPQRDLSTVPAAGNGEPARRAQRARRRRGRDRRGPPDQRRGLRHQLTISDFRKNTCERVLSTFAWSP